MADCHKCKYEVTAECVPRSQKMGFPNCYQSTITRADIVRAMSDEELAEWYWWMLKYVQGYTESRCALLDWLREEASDDEG